jgi:solute carrier family 25 (mitochondrial dicarboxylate transporter), member 10
MGGAVLQVRLQTMTSAGQGGAAGSGGMIGTAVAVVRAEGPRGLYKGLSASLLRQGTYSLVRFAAYDWLSGRMRESCA